MARKPLAQRWLKMGVELEGSWNAPRDNVVVLATGAQVDTHDRSMTGLPGHMGEITTRPHSIMGHLLRDVGLLYPNHTNNTCGLHAHASFSLLDYSTLADKEFYDFFRTRWTAWGKENEDKMGDLRRVYWARLEGRWKSANIRHGAGGNFCKAEFDPCGQLADPNQAHRYTQINFSAWHKFKTIETRHLPMFHTVELAISALEETADIYDDYLASHQFPKLSLYKEWRGEGGMLIDETVLKTPNMVPMEESKSSDSPGLLVGPDIEYAIEGAEGFMLPFNREVIANQP